MNNCIWTLDGTDSLAHKEIIYGTPTHTNQKRPHWWDLDASEQQHFSNKKHATESDKATSGSAVMNDYLFGESFCSQADQLGDCLFSNKTLWSSNLYDTNTASSGSADLNTEKKCIQDEFQNDSFFALSMSRAVEDPLCLNSSIPKLKDNNMPSENCWPKILGNTSYHTEENKLASTRYQSSDHNVFPGPYCSNQDENTFSMAITDKNFISVGQPSMVSDGSMNQYYGRIKNDMLPFGLSFSRVNAAGECEKDSDNVISGGLTYSKGREDLFTVDPFYSKVGNVYMSADSAFNKRNTDALSEFSTERQLDAAVGTSKTVCNKDNLNILSMVSNCKRAEPTTLSFGGFEDDPKKSDSFNWSYDIMLNESSVNPGLKDAFRQLNAAPSIDCSNKNKEPKTTRNVSSNNFPTNVKSLLSTGILDGVPVKYVSWAREKNLRGVICGTGYLCGCQDCKLSKAINAYEFERHAACKTKHPNNHIYFENGKTIYAVVQELKNTPPHMLFEVIQNVAGSPINQKNFHLWKASYQAASRELRRIYASDGQIVS